MSLISVIVISTKSTSNFWSKEFILAYNFQVEKYIAEKNKGRNSKLEHGVEAVQGHCFMTWFPWLMLS